MFKKLLTVTLALSLASFSHAQSIEELTPLTTYFMSEYFEGPPKPAISYYAELPEIYYDAEFIEELTKQANVGKVSAQKMLGSIYEYGEGVPKDYQKAVEWWSKAAEQGDAFAQYHLGEIYRQGKGVPKDYQKALEWFSKATEQGYAGAQFKLGELYRYGTGVKRDLAQAKEWYGKACDNGYKSGCYEYRRLSNNEKALIEKQRASHAQKTSNRNPCPFANNLFPCKNH